MTTSGFTLYPTVFSKVEKQDDTPDCRKDFFTLSRKIKTFPSILFIIQIVSVDVRVRDYEL